jgi:hypothetical protein
MTAEIELIKLTSMYIGVVIATAALTLCSWVYSMVKNRTKAKQWLLKQDPRYQQAVNTYLAIKEGEVQE